MKAFLLKTRYIGTPVFSFLLEIFALIVVWEANKYVQNVWSNEMLSYDFGFEITQTLYSYVRTFMKTSFLFLTVVFILHLTHSAVISLRQIWLNTRKNSNGKIFDYEFT